MADETKNVKISIEDRINSQLGTLTILWPGTELDTDGLTEWIEPDDLGFSSSPVRKGERDEEWTVSFNCFARTGAAGETTHRVYELRDLVLAAFAQFDLAILNWAVADPKPTLFWLRFNEGDANPIDVPDEKFTMQHNVTFSAVLIG